MTKIKVRNSKRMSTWFTPKQLEYFVMANKKINIFGGATGSGKTYAGLYLIRNQIKRCSGKNPIVILGNTQATVERNILSEMRSKFGEHNVGIVSAKGVCRMFGKKVYVLGADKKSQVARLQGLNIEYVYGDEIVTWAPEVWAMLMSRLRLPNSRFDGACNPDGPRHWLKLFIDEQYAKEESKRLLYYLSTTIEDAHFSSNPEEDRRIKEEMKAAQSGVYYERYMLGKWAKAEGLIYSRFAMNPGSYLIEKENIDNIGKLSIGVDFGGNKSKHSFVATGISKDFRELYVLKSKRLDPNGMGPEDLAAEYVKFLLEIESEYGRKVDYTYADSAEPVLITGMKQELIKRGLNRIVWNAAKRKINDRIRATDILIGTNKLFYTKDALTVRDALLEAVWDGKKDTQERLDDGSSDIDTLDSFEYTFERDIEKLTKFAPEE